MPVFIPLDLLALADGESVSFKVVRWEVGEGDIKPRDSPNLKRVRILRVWVDPADKAEGAPWWDITAQTTIERMVPLLEGAALEHVRFTLTMRGIPPIARHTVKVEPV